MAERSGRITKKARRVRFNEGLRDFLRNPERYQISDDDRREFLSRGEIEKIGNLLSLEISYGGFGPGEMCKMEGYYDETGYADPTLVLFGLWPDEGIENWEEFSERCLSDLNKALSPFSPNIVVWVPSDQWEFWKKMVEKGLAFDYF